MTRHAGPMLKVKRSKMKVTRSRDVSADKNAITRQWTVISTSHLVGFIDVRINACDILSSICMRSTNVAENSRNCEYLLNF